MNNLIKYVGEVHTLMRQDLKVHTECELAFQNNCIVLRWKWLGSTMDHSLTYAEYNNSDQLDCIKAVATKGNKLVRIAQGYASEEKGNE